MSSIWGCRIFVWKLRDELAEKLHDVDFSDIIGMYNTPSAEYMLVDIADEIRHVSRKRFSGLNNVHHRIMDYTKLLPEDDFDAIISALSIHHLDDA